MTIPQVNGYSNYLYPYQTYSPPQFNNWNNYGYSTPVFRGAESQPVMQQPLKQDTVQISAEKEIKTNKKEGLSTGAKWAIGLATSAAAVYGCVVGHRMLTKPSIVKVAKNFSEIFRRDVSKEEAKVLTEKYKEIFKVEEYDDFCKRIFEQAKKDFGYEKVGIKLKVNKMADTSVGSALSKHEIASYNCLNGILTLNPTHSKNGKMSGTNKLEMLEALMHEFQHTKQSEFAYRTNPLKYFDACQARRDSPAKTVATDMITSLEDMLKSKYDLTKYMKEHNLKTVEAAKAEINNLIKTLKEKEHVINTLSSVKIPLKEQLAEWDNLFGKLPRFKEGTKEYEQGLKYIEGQANYVSANSKNYEAYTQQLVEEEAFSAGNKANEIYNFFANPWRLF